MTLEPLSDMSASNLRTLLISEIQEFIRSLEIKQPVEKLISKRDYIRRLIEILSKKESVEYEEMVGQYFHNYKQMFSP